MPLKSLEACLRTTQLDEFTDIEANTVQIGESSGDIIFKNRSNKGAFDIVSEYVDHSVDGEQDNLRACDPAIRMSSESMKFCEPKNNENITCDQRKSRSSNRIYSCMTQKCYPLSDVSNFNNFADRRPSLPAECSNKNIDLDNGGKPVSPDYHLRNASEPKTRHILGLMNSPGSPAPKSHDPTSTAFRSLGFPDVHELIYSTAVAGQSLIDNKGKVMPSTMDFILSASAVQSPIEMDRKKYNSVNPNHRQQLSTKRSMQLQPNQKSQPALSPCQAYHQKAITLQHPFLQFWEHGVHKELGGAWKSRRNTYLSFHLENYADISRYQDHSRSGTRHHKRSTKGALNHTSLSSSNINLQQTDSTEIAVKESIMCSLQPCLLGQRWPDISGNCKSLPSHCESESLLLWQ